MLLILYLSALAAHPATTLPAALPSIYIVPAHPFGEVDTFVAASARAYRLDLVRMAGVSMRDAFADYLATRREVRAVLVGTRRTDPHGGALGAFDLTDGGWPAFMRVHPVIEWHYREIWAVSLGAVSLRVSRGLYGRARCGILGMRGIFDGRG